MQAKSGPKVSLVASLTLFIIGCIVGYAIHYPVHGFVPSKPIHLMQNSVSSSGTQVDDIMKGNENSASSSGKLFQMTDSIRRYVGDHKFSSPGKTASTYPKLGKECKKWGVVTTIFAPTDTLNQIASHSDWCLVISGDLKSPPKEEMLTDIMKGSNVVYLSPQDQKNLPYKTKDFLEWNHFGRKNIGYLYAIHHGAEYIYDVDDDNVLIDPKKGPPTNLFNSTDEMKWASTEHHLLNPYPYYDPAANNVDSEFMWPRGFPLEFVNQKETYLYEFQTSSTVKSKITVIQSLANNDPDVDAAYRLTRKLPITFRKTDHSLALPAGVLTPFNAQATLFKRDAFWGILLPVTVHGRVTDIWRSYFLERLMWDLNQAVAFTPAFVNQFRNPHSYLADFESEMQLYLRAGALTSFLVGWVPTDENLPLAGRIEELAITMFEYGILEERDVVLTQAFLEDLTMMGYKFPSVSSPFAGRTAKIAGTVDGRRSSGKL